MNLWNWEVDGWELGSHQTLFNLLVDSRIYAFQCRSENLRKWCVIGFFAQLDRVMKLTGCKACSRHITTSVYALINEYDVCSGWE